MRDPWVLVVIATLGRWVLSWREYSIYVRPDFCSCFGLALASVVNQLRLVAHLSRWLDGKGLSVEDLTGDRVEPFTRERRSSYRWRSPERPSGARPHPPQVTVRSRELQSRFLT